MASIPFFNFPHCHMQHFDCISRFGFFSGPHPQHMEVPRLGVESELQLPAYATATAIPVPSYVCNLHHRSWQYRIPNPLSKARDQTHNLMVPRWIHFYCAKVENPCFFVLFCFLGWHPRHRKVQGSNHSYSQRPLPQPQKHQIQDMSVTYTTAHGKARSLTH